MNLYENNILSAGFGPDENSLFDVETKWYAEELKSLEPKDRCNHSHRLCGFNDKGECELDRKQCANFPQDTA